MRQEMVMRVTYTNHKGNTRLRVLYPCENALWFGVTKFYRDEQWFLRAVDLEDGNRVKDFALSGFMEVEKVPAESMPQPTKPATEVTRSPSRESRMQDVVDTIGDLGRLPKASWGSGFEDGE